MKHFQWNDKLATGEPLVDEQHKKLLGLGQLVWDSIATGCSRELLIQTIKDMVNYAGQHFAEEEAYMIKMNYPQFPMHKKLHDDLKAQLVEYIRSLQAGTVPLGSKIAVFLENWIVSHILEQDQKMIAWAKSQA